MIGRVIAPAGTSFAALTLTPDGEFDGAIMRKPYNSVEMNFEFVRPTE